MPYLELAGFGSVTQIRYTVLRFDLLSALVKRWRPETHTFHFPCGKCTVTLEDVALQLGLPIDGSPVTGLSAFTDPDALFYQLLGDSPGDGESYFSGVQFTWLKAKYGQLSTTATEGELMCAARAYIMHIIGGEIMPDASNDKVHLMYLPLLADLSTVSSYSWGSAVLAVLYRELCRATDSKVRDIGGCLSLLQSWALYRMPFLASWSGRLGIGQSYNVPLYRLMIEQYARDGFIWTPYRTLEITAVVPSSAYVHSYIWCTNAPIINFNMVEWYYGDRVLRQFACEVGEVHGKNKRGKLVID
ncbi:protein MAINTENANCE OF MERISTEMS-like [Gossypium hirsutum]|uniref:Protein MAINTENANCE OF MERISTEMS-like n=1 Tax=Gossypium hirsutum TaxID=3635 RepID=A0A1U8KM35_GOSHI|nr:protein MAINTENANCE OF MERISTEMS-like [Gossypium hirsutum]